jgi:hypothetical protein
LARRQAAVGRLEPVAHTTVTTGASRPLCGRWPVSALGDQNRGSLEPALTRIHRAEFGCSTLRLPLRLQ